MKSRRRLAVAAKVVAALVIIAAASGKLPHLVLTQAVISTLLALVVAPLWLLGRPESGPGSHAWTRVPPFLAVGAIAAGTIAIQLPPVVGVISDGGVPAVLALSALLAGALCFWSVVVAPARVSGLAACGYVVIGGVPISIPASILYRRQGIRRAGRRRRRPARAGATSSPRVGPGAGDGRSHRRRACPLEGPREGGGGDALSAPAKWPRRLPRPRPGLRSRQPLACEPARCRSRAWPLRRPAGGRPRGACSTPGPSPCG